MAHVNIYPQIFYHMDISKIPVSNNFNTNLKSNSECNELNASNSMNNDDLGVINAKIKRFPCDFEVVEIPLSDGKVIPAIDCEDDTEIFQSTIINKTLVPTNTMHNDKENDIETKEKNNESTFTMSLEAYVPSEQLHQMEIMNSWWSKFHSNIKDTKDIKEGTLSSSSLEEYKNAIIKKISINCITISIIEPDKSVRRMFHDALKERFPYLRTETLKDDTSNSNNDLNKSVQINIFPDDFYVNLLLFQFDSDDIQKLYMFRSKGPTTQSLESTLQLICPSYILSSKSHKTQFYEKFSKYCHHFDFKINNDKKLLSISWNNKALKNYKRKFSAISNSSSTNVNMNILNIDEVKSIYLNFRLCKYNVEHSIAIQYIADRIGCHINDITYAGIKDRRAKTLQYCCLSVSTKHIAKYKTFNLSEDEIIRRITRKGIEGLVSLANPFYFHGSSKDNSIKDDIAYLFVDSITPATQPMFKGQLWGNQFHILLRNISMNSSSSSSSVIPILRNRITIIEKFGFPNYFGSQRMGWNDSSIIKDTNHLPVCSTIVEGIETSLDFIPQGVLAGIYLVRNCYEDVVNVIILGQTSNCAMKKYRELVNYQTSFTTIEKAQQMFLDNKPLQEVIKAFPNSCQREISILQSLKKLYDNIDTNPIDFKVLMNQIPYNLRNLWINASQSWFWNQMVSYRIQKFGHMPMLGDLIDMEGIRLLTEDDLETYKENIDQLMACVVYPLYGSKIIYPSNEYGDLYKAMLQRYHIHYDPNADNSFYPKGAYRKLIVSNCLLSY